VCMWSYIKYSECGFGLHFYMPFKLINYFKSELFLCQVLACGMYSCLELTREIQIENIIYLIKGKSCVYFILYLCNLRTKAIEFFFGVLASLVFSLWLTLRRDIDALDEINLEMYFPTEKFEGNVNPASRFDYVHVSYSQ
jgi:hypothetical protein